MKKQILTASLLLLTLTSCSVSSKIDHKRYEEILQNLTAVDAKDYFLNTTYAIDEVDMVGTSKRAFGLQSTYKLGEGFNYSILEKDQDYKTSAIVAVGIKSDEKVYVKETISDKDQTKQRYNFDSFITPDTAYFSTTEILDFQVAILFEGFNVIKEEPLTYIERKDSRNSKITVKSSLGSVDLIVEGREGGKYNLHQANFRYTTKTRHYSRSLTLKLFDNDRGNKIDKPADYQSYKDA